ncbi:MAG: hypothetical protein U9R79_05300 [Armatimonadota bacterium]|nr:hypothetical protein [Armatimonadota bacterium]
MAWLDLPAEPAVEDEQLREGRDFVGVEELMSRSGRRDRRVVDVEIAGRLARAVIEEMRWAGWSGELPGGLPWDRQPSWRVRLWEHWLSVRDEAVAQR